MPNGEEIVPVVFLGGNGGSMWSNARSGQDFIQRYLDKDVKYFDVYSFSYRGYEPNEHLGVSEKKVVADSIDFVNWVMDKVRPSHLVETNWDKKITAPSSHILPPPPNPTLQFPNRRPIIVSHSLGTGPASAVSEHFQDSLSCIVFGMPFSTMTQTSQEVAYYTPMIYLYLVDRWNSVGRVKKMSPEVPVVILSAGKDELIAPHHQKSMFEAANSNDKLFSYVEEGRHMDIMDAIYLLGVEYDDWFERGCMGRRIIS